MLYKYYIKDDPNKEALALIEASNIKAAYRVAAGLKDLSLDIFKKLYKVEVYEYRKEGNNSQS